MAEEYNYYPITVSTPQNSTEPSFNTPITVPSNSNIIPAPNGTIMNGGTMQSPNFSHNNSGWRIDSNGNVEFGNGQFRGDITGASGSFSGTVSIGTGDNIFIAGINGIQLGDATFADAPFSVSMAGVLKATLGTIANWNISPTAFSTGAFDTNGNMYFGTSGLSLSDVFKVTSAGVLTAKSGVIGGFTITATELYGGIIKTGATVAAGSNGVIMDTDGLRGYDSVLGQTFNLPTDGTPPTFASGIIQNTEFQIQTNAVLRTSDTVGDGSANSHGILINNSGVYGCEDNQLLADANIKLLATGSAVIKMNVKGGQTDYNTGTGYFLGLSGGDYKFSIGSAAGNYMNWDGTYLKLKGSFDVGTSGLINNAVYTVADLPVAPTVVGWSPPAAYE